MVFTFSARSNRGTPAARVFVAAAIAIALSGCSGGSGANGPSVLPPAAQPGRGTTTPVTFTIKWPQPTSTQGHAPQFLPGTARSVLITVNRGTVSTGLFQFVNAPTSTITIDAPVGDDLFYFEAYDLQNAQGQVLADTWVEKNIILGAANTISATLNGVVASIGLALGNPAPNAGVSATTPVNVTTYDLDGDVILSPGDYDQIVRLSIVDPANSGTLSLSTSTIPNSTTTSTLTYNGGTLSTATVVAKATGIPTVSTAFAPTPTFYQFSIPVGTNKPQWIAAGSDGNMWFTEFPGNAVARITPAGVVTEFAIPTAASNPQNIIGSSDGKLWFTEFATSKIGNVTTSGTFTEFSTLFAPNDGPQGLVDRADGNVWYVGLSGNHVGYQGITSGLAGETTITTPSSQPFGVAEAPDLNLYFTESAAGVNKIGRIPNLLGTITEVALTAGTHPLQIVLGPDKNLWFTENGVNKIGRLAPGSFSVTGEFPTLTANSTPTGITVGADGALWFTETGQDKIGRITTGGVVTEYSSPVTGLALQGIATGPDGSLWFTEPGSGLNPGKIGRLVY